MKIYGIYDKNELCIYVGTITEIVKNFNCHRTTIYKAIERKSKFLGKYEIIEIYKE